MKITVLHAAVKFLGEDGANSPNKLFKINRREKKDKKKKSEFFYSFPKSSCVFDKFQGFRRYKEEFKDGGPIHPDFAQNNSLRILPKVPCRC